MPPIIEGPPTRENPSPPLLQRLAWFALIWLASIAVVAAVTFALRLLIVR